MSEKHSVGENEEGEMIDEPTISSSEDKNDLNNASPTPSHSTSAHNLHAWVDIFAASKLVLMVTPRNLLNPYIMVQHAQKEFLSNFGFSNESLPIPLSSLFGPSTERNKIVRLEQCMLTGRNYSEFINLHKSSGGSLSCYVSLLCLSSRTENTSSTSGEPYGTVNLEYSTHQNVTKYGILTIRSASVVGNSKYSGIGLMGTDRVPKERMKDLRPAH